MLNTIGSILESFQSFRLLSLELYKSPASKMFSPPNPSSFKKQLFIYHISTPFFPRDLPDPPLKVVYNKTN